MPSRVQVWSAVQGHVLDEAKPVAGPQRQSSRAGASARLLSRISTVLIFKGEMSAAAAAAMPPSTSSSRSRRVSSANRSRSRVSSEMLMRSSPAETSSRPSAPADAVGRSDNSVAAAAPRAGRRRHERRVHQRLAAGQNRMVVTPRAMNTCASRTISSSLQSVGLGSPVQTLGGHE